MITNTHSWSLGLSSRSLAKEEATPNKSLDQFGALICSHSQSDPIGAAQLAPSCFQAFCILTSAFCIGRTSGPEAGHSRNQSRSIQSIESICPDSCSFVSIRGLPAFLCLPKYLISHFSH